MKKKKHNQTKQCTKSPLKGSGFMTSRSRWMMVGNCFSVIDFPSYSYFYLFLFFCYVLFWNFLYQVVLKFNVWLLKVFCCLIFLCVCLKCDGCLKTCFFLRFEFDKKNRGFFKILFYAIAPNFFFLSLLFKFLRDVMDESGRN